MKQKFVMAVLGLSVGLVACGPGEKEGEGEKITHATTQQGLSNNTLEISARVASAGGFLDSARILNSVANSGALDAFYAQDVLVDCIDEPCEQPEPEPIEVDLGIGEFDETGQQIAQYLEENIFTDQHVEASTATSITYRISGASMCEGDAQCISMVDDAEIRIRVTSPAANNYDLDLLIGPNQENPISGSLYTDELGVEVDLGGIKGALEHLQSVGFEVDTSDLPSTMEGRVRAEVRVEGQERVAFAFAVLEAIDVREGLFGVQLAPSDPTWELTLDGAAQTLEAVSNVSTLDVQAQIESETGSNNLDVHLGGSSATVLLDAASDIISITNIGLGDSTTTAAADGNQFLAIDLNENNGRRFDVELSVGSADELVMEVSPAFDLNVVMQLSNALDLFGDVEDWMMDEVLSVTLDGASAPKISANENGLQVLDGQLTIGMANAGITHTITAGQCLIDASMPDQEPATNPLEEVVAGACE